MKHYVAIILLIGISGACMLNPLSAYSATNKNVKKPNILVIMADDLGYGDISITGGRDVQTPHIDDLFSRGVMMTEFYTSSSVGSPIQASFLTGKYPGLVGVPGVIRKDPSNNWGYFRADTTLSGYLQQSGYTTALIGKWNLGFESPNLPNEQGFDLFMGFLGDQFDADRPLSQNSGSMLFNENSINPSGHTTDLFSNWSIDFINREAEAEKPFFLFLAYNAPGEFPSPKEEWVESVQKDHPHLSRNRTKNIAAIEHMDDGIGRILETLDNTNQLKNTIIIFSSENSGLLATGSSNGKLRGGKQDLYEGGIRVPTCIFWRDKIKRQSICHQVGITMDLFPTICEMCELKPTNNLDGSSLTSCILKGLPLQKERTLFWVCREGGVFEGKASYAVRQGAYKLMQNNPNEDLRLYNLTTDSYEQIPLRKSSEHYQRLYQLLQAHIRKNESVPWTKSEEARLIIQSN